MKKIDLEGILDRELRTVSLLSKDIDVDKVLSAARKAMKEAISQALELASENAKVKELCTDDYYSSNYHGNEIHSIATDGDGEPFALYEYTVSKQSILDTINQIE